MTVINWSEAPEGTDFYANGKFYKVIDQVLMVFVLCDNDWQRAEPIHPWIYPDYQVRVIVERGALAAKVEDLEFQRVCAVTQAANMFDALRLAIAAFDRYEMSVDDYPSIEHVRMRERLYSAAFLNADRHLVEIRAEAGRAGYMQAIHDLGYQDSCLTDRANKYAAKVRQGGAE